MTTLSFSFIGTPRTSRSRVTVRRKWLTGVTQRRVSSTACEMSSGLERMSAIWSGFWSSASMPPDRALRVVSLPATESSRKKASNSISDSFSPSISELISTLMRSVPSLSRRSSASELAYIQISIADWRASSIEVWNSGSSKPMSWFDQSKIFWRSSRGTPSSSAMTRSGSSAAMSRTKSQAPVPLAMTSLRISSTSARILGSISCTMRGVKPRATSLRKRACCGGSMFTISSWICERSSSA